jgi:hypothetical protein
MHIRARRHVSTAEGCDHAAELTPLVTSWYGSEGRCCNNAAAPGVPVLSVPGALITLHAGLGMRICVGAG